MTMRATFCIERLLVVPSEARRPQRSTRTTSRARLWTPGSTLHVRFISGTRQQRTRAREQAGWWSSEAYISFEFDDAPDAELRVAFEAAECPWSYIGTDARHVPPDQPTMNVGAAEGAIAAHEFGHALGLTHVRQNPAGGSCWNLEAIARDLAGPPLYCTGEQARLFSEHRNFDGVLSTTFDPKSIMLEFYPAEWCSDGRPIQPNNSLSGMDCHVIAHLYPKG